MRNIGKRKNRRSGKIKDILVTYVKNNSKEFAIITLLFTIGLIFGIIFINNASQTQIEEISSYINTFISNIKEDVQIDKIALLQDTLLSNFLLVLAFWFMGSTVIGIPIVYGMIIYRGFCLGYTISSSIAILGTNGRNYFYIIIYITSKYNIYSLLISLGSKWNEIVCVYCKG